MKKTTPRAGKAQTFKPALAARGRCQGIPYIVLKMPRALHLPSFYCGYAKLPKGRRITQKMRGIDVHGGITFAGAPHGQTGTWLGFDCGHGGDLIIERGGKRKKNRRDLKFVRAECRKLCAALAPMLNQTQNKKSKKTK